MNKKHAKILCFIILSTLISLIFVLPVAAKNNIALDCVIDSCCGESSESTSAHMLIDDDVNYDTKWEASDGSAHGGEPHWIILDFGEEKNIDALRLVKASQGAADFGKTELDANAFRFEISSDKKNWAVFDDVTDDGDRDIYSANYIHVCGRYLKLVVTQPEQNENSDENQAVRLYDLKVFEYILPDEENDGDDSDEFSVIDSTSVPDDRDNPQTSDSGSAVLLLTVAFAALFVTAPIFSNRRNRSV